jgi:5'-methylthioadenosine phosphorylase
LLETMLGVIGGSGLYDLPDLTAVESRSLTTPFGDPSSPVVMGELDGLRIAFLARHGRGHRLNPTEVPYRANVWALRELGVTHVLSVSAVGSLQEALAPRTAVLPDQVIDRTVSRPRTFFEDGIVAHVGLADPFCVNMRRTILDLGQQRNVPFHDGGTYVCIEGPQFSTRAESQLYRSWNGAVIGMTAMPEARLAREAGLCYATMAMVTDYDVWHDAEEDVTVEMVLKVLHDNIETGRAIVRDLARSGLPSREQCGCGRALTAAIVTAPDAISDEARRRLGLLLGEHRG